MPSFEDTVRSAIAEGVLPGVVAIAKDVQGKTYTHAAGKTSVDASAKDLQLGTPMQIASMTKLVASIAVMQIVERGLIGLDDDVKQHIPELLEQGILQSVNDDGTPVTEPVKNKLTLRLLLTHSSGSIYDGYHPDLSKVKKAKGFRVGGGNTINDRALQPLLFEPGTDWRYGYSIDWAGRVLEKITGDTLDAWMKKNIWPQLGVKNIAFSPYVADSVRGNLPKIAVRNPETGKLSSISFPFLNDGTTDCFGGHGLVASMDEYVKVLYSLLANDGKLLKKDTVDQMFQPNLTPQAKNTFQRILASSIGDTFVGDFPHPTQYDWGLGGLLVTQDHEGRRKKGTMIWSGAANCYWFIDREAGVCGVFGTQVIPPGDLKVREVIKAFEFDAYRQLHAKL